MAMRLRHLTASALLASVVLLSQGGCTAFRGETRLDRLPQQPGLVFQGLLGSDSTAARTPRRFVFAIHGMGDTPDTYNEETGAWLRNARFESVGDPSPWVRVHLRAPMSVAGEGLPCAAGTNTDPCLFESFGRYRRQDFKRGAETVTVVTYFWQEDLWQVQGPYLRDDLRERRALINRSLKNEVVNKGLGDAAGYLGPMGELVREGVRGAVCSMLKMAAEQPIEVQPVNLRPLQVGAVMTAGKAGSECLAGLATLQLPDDLEFNFISHSLGSRMLLDALAPYSGSADASQRGEDDAAKAELAQRTRTIFMAANQVPLLGIGRVRVTEARDDRLGAPPCDTGSFLDLRCTPVVKDADGRVTVAGPMPMRLDVVAFMDPDDLLGYKADSAMLGLGRSDDPGQEGYANVRFTTVRHRNASQLLWALTWPRTAHDHEMQRKSAAVLIFCGARVDQLGRVRPSTKCLD